MINLHTSVAHSRVLSVCSERMPPWQQVSLTSSDEEMAHLFREETMRAARRMDEGASWNLVFADPQQVCVCVCV